MGNGTGDKVSFSIRDSWWRVAGIIIFAGSGLWGLSNLVSVNAQEHARLENESKSRVEVVRREREIELSRMQQQLMAKLGELFTGQAGQLEAINGLKTQVSEIRSGAMCSRPDRR